MNIALLLSIICLYPSQIEEKIIYQLIFKSYDITERNKIIKDIKKGIGGIHLLWGTYDLKDTQNLTSEIYSSYTDYPPFISIDYEGGPVYLHQTLGLLDLPSNMAIGKANDKKNTSVLYYLVGLELKKAGINMVFAPTLDVNTEPKNPIINIRAFSSDPQTVYLLGDAVIDGLKASGIINVIKHFPGHGMTSQDSHLILPKTDITPIELYQTHIYPFKKIIEEKKSDVIMLSHILYKNIDENYPASLSEIIMNKILRQQLNFGGIIITDSLDMKAISSNYKIEDAALISLKNGSDMVLIGRYNAKKVVRRIMKGIEKGEITLDLLEKKYRRIVELKEEYKLKDFTLYNDQFDTAYKKIVYELLEKSINTPKCTKLNYIKSRKLDVFFSVPQRYLQHAVVFYNEMKNINPETLIFTDINEIKKKGKKEALIVANYSWPYMNEERKKELLEIRKNYDYAVFVNLSNPYNTLLVIDNFDCIIETYGINEFSMKALGRFLSKRLETN